MDNISSTKPYLIRALFDWCVDNNYTPYIVVLVDKNTRVPMPYVHDGQIVLNIAPYATNQLSITNEDISCQARFNGAVQSLYVPIGNVVSIYSRETGQGIAFERGMRSGSAMELGGAVEWEDGPEDEQAGETRAEEADSSGDATEGAQVPNDAPATEPEPPKTPTPPRTSHLRIVK